MEPSACRAELARLIPAETDSLAELARLLDREHQHLVANDVVALESAIRERQQCVARIVRVDAERSALCRKLKHTPDAKGLEALLRWCDAQGTLAAGWARCAELARKCRELNDRNGALVGARLKHVQGRLAVLLSSRGDTVAYGKKGGYGAPNVGRVVATEA